jgi:primosomal protein N'
MKVKKILGQSNKRFITVIYECEHCGSILETYTCDDMDLHKHENNLLKCVRCGKTSLDGYVPLRTKYTKIDNRN